MLTRPVLLYDGNCGFCIRWVERIRRWDRHRRVQLIASQRRHEIPELPAIPVEALDRAMHLVLPDLTVVSGGGAVREVLRYLPGGAGLRLLLRIPGMPAVVDRGYGWVAARRHRLGCSEGTCGV
jgi:acetyl esterase